MLTVAPLAAASPGGDWYHGELAEFMPPHPHSIAARDRIEKLDVARIIVGVLSGLCARRKGDRGRVFIGMASLVVAVGWWHLIGASRKA
jgi:hypothetical protein